jgi:hypothetical protein
VKSFAPGAFAGLTIALIGAVFGQIPIVILGVVIGILWIALISMRASQAVHPMNIADDLSADSRILIKPLRTMYTEIESAAEGKSPSLSAYLAKEALQESRQLLEKSATALAVRDKLAKQMRAKYDAQKSITDIESRLATSMSDDEKTSLKTALAARQQELTHYDTLQQGIDKIETSVRQAGAIMAEMRANMLSSASAGLAEQQNDPLRESMGRMQALTASMSETQQMLEQTN